MTLLIPMNSISFLKESEQNISVFNTFARKHQLVGRAQADHICYKCESSEVFEKIRQMFEQESYFIYQSIISKRRIAYIKFGQGIETALGTISFLELSDQKPDGSQQNGFDHIEVYSTPGTYEVMVEELERTEQVIKVDRPHHPTHDIELEGGFIFRCTRGPLLEKIKNSEML